MQKEQGEVTPHQRQLEFVKHNELSQTSIQTVAQLFPIVKAQTQVPEEEHNKPTDLTGINPILKLCNSSCHAKKTLSMGKLDVSGKTLHAQGIPISNMPSATSENKSNNVQFQSLHPAKMYQPRKYQKAHLYSTHLPTCTLSRFRPISVDRCISLMPTLSCMIDYHCKLSIPLTLSHLSTRVDFCR